MAWNKAVPVSASKVYDLSSIYSDNWNAIDNAFSSGHASIGATVPGLHTLGEVGIIRKDTTDNINTLSGTAVSGALALDSTIGQMKYFRGAPWKPVNSLNRSCVVARLNTNYTVTSSYTTVPFSGCASNIDKDQRISASAEMYNVAPSAGVFKPLRAGLYLVTTNMVFYEAEITTGEPGEYYYAWIDILRSGGTHGFTTVLSQFQATSQRDASVAVKKANMNITAVCPIAAGDYVKIKVGRSSYYPSHTVVILATNSFLSIYRVM